VPQAQIREFRGEIFCVLRIVDHDDRVQSWSAMGSNAFQESLELRGTIMGRNDNRKAGTGSRLLPSTKEPSPLLGR
jgi:hypothetical protein